jgi:hypothetical protein
MQHTSYACSPAGPSQAKPAASGAYAALRFVRSAAAAVAAERAVRGERVRDSRSATRECGVGARGERSLALGLHASVLCGKELCLYAHSHTYARITRTQSKLSRRTAGGPGCSRLAGRVRRPYTRERGPKREWAKEGMGQSGNGPKRAHRLWPTHGMCMTAS